MRQLLIAIGLIGIILLAIYGSWSCKRRINYTFGYESLVHEQIQKELKPLNARLDIIEKKLGK